MSVDQPAWELDAACLDHPEPDLWFPEKDEGQDNHGTAAKRVCATCPSLIPCLEAAIDRDEEFGIWGGAGGDERRRLRRVWLVREGDPTAWQEALEHHIGRLDGTVTEIADRNGTGATHGLASTYARGCRCRPCKLAITERASRPDRRTA